MRISIVGSGNVSTHLAKHLYKKGHDIAYVYSRSLGNAAVLAKEVSSIAIDDVKMITPDADVILICVSDNAIEQIIDSLNFEPKLIAHTAGSVSIDSLEKFSNRGVFYPLQTFSKQRDVNMKQVPFCIEANNSNSLDLLKELAESISDTVIELTSEQRLQCHISAVFACNFTNHMYAISEQLLSQKNIPFDILKPIILETANKIQSLSPINAQTGPAVRNDTNTINHHLSLLSSSHLEKIYSFVSKSIYDMNGEIEKD